MPCVDALFWSREGCGCWQQAVRSWGSFLQQLLVEEVQVSRVFFKWEVGLGCTQRSNTDRSRRYCWVKGSCVEFQMPCVDALFWSREGCWCWQQAGSSWGRLLQQLLVEEVQVFRVFLKWEVGLGC
jgi:hypothetical protein